MKKKSSFPQTKVKNPEPKKKSTINVKEKVIKMIRKIELTTFNIFLKSITNLIFKYFI